jgi:hypothetical protein
MGMPGERDKEIVFSAEQWRQVRTDERLIGIATLARATNALAMAYPVLMTPVTYQSPRARRDRTSAFLYAAAVLFEGLQVSRGLTRYFKDLPQFQAGFALIHADRAVQTLETRFLKRLRDKAAFHFDRDVLAKGFKELDFEDARFASGRGWRTGSTYFDIVDDAVLVFLTGASSDNEHLELLDHYMTSTAALANRFLIASHRLIPRVLRLLGARMRTIRATRGAA